METKTFISRIAMARKINRESSANPALSAQFVGYDNMTGLVQVRSADNGLYYQQKITNQKFSTGESIPASVQFGQLGFADGRNL